MTVRQIRNTTILLTLGLYIAALTQPAYCTHESVGALTILLLGPLGLLMEAGALADTLIQGFSGKGFVFQHPIGATFTWLANPLLLLALLFIKRKTTSTILFSLLSTVLMLIFPLFGSVIDDEAGHYQPITSLQAGYWLWLLSSIILLAGAFWLKKKQTGDPLQNP